MKYFILTVTTNSGEAEYTQYISLAVLPDENIEVEIHKYMSKFWGEDTFIDKGFYCDFHASTSIDGWQEIPEDELNIIRKYISI